MARDRRLRALPPRRRARWPDGTRRRARHGPRPDGDASSGSGCTSRPRPSSRRSPWSSGCTRSPSRTRSTPTSGPRSRSSPTRCSSCSRRCATTRTTQQVELGDVMLFVGDSFIVSVRHGKGRALGDIRQPAGGEPDLLELRPVRGALRRRRPRRRRLQRDRLRGRGGHRGGRGAGLLARTAATTRRRIYNLKREVIEFRRAVLPAGGADVPARRPARCRMCTSGCSRSSATWPTTRVRVVGAGRRLRRPARRRCSTPTWPRSACSRTRTCAGSRPGWRSPPSPRRSPGSTA